VRGDWRNYALWCHDLLLTQYFIGVIKEGNIDTTCSTQRRVHLPFILIYSPVVHISGCQVAVATEFFYGGA